MAKRGPASRARAAFAPRAKTLGARTPIEAYEHDDKRLNLPSGGDADFDGLPRPKKKYGYDPHLDPALQWAGKSEHTAVRVDTTSLHIHQFISAQAILQAAQRENAQRSLFDEVSKKPIEFYEHEVGWSNRMILGDSLVVMNSLLERERLAGKVQCIYVDPPYGVKFNSNFQPSISKRDVKDADDTSLTREPEQIQAYRDTWELGVHSYLTYLRDRLLLARDLLPASGSIFVQISDENVHHVRELMDEVFGCSNFALVLRTRHRLAEAQGDRCRQIGHEAFNNRAIDVAPLTCLFESVQDRRDCTAFGRFCVSGHGASFAGDGRRRAGNGRCT